MENNPVNFIDPTGLCPDTNKMDEAKGKWAKGAAMAGVAGLYGEMTGLALSYPVALVGSVMAEVLVAPLRPFVDDIPSPVQQMHEGYYEAGKAIINNMRGN